MLDAKLIFLVVGGFGLVGFEGVGRSGLVGFAVKESGFFGHDVKIRKIIMEYS